MDINKYKKEFENLRPNRTSTHTRPHKACMLLAVIDLIERGVISKNEIRFGTELRDAFSERFAVFKQGNDKDDPAQPFFYLSSSSFWRLVPAAGKETELEDRLNKRQHGSTKQVEELIGFAMLEPELFQLLQNDVYRAMLAEVLEAELISNEEAFKRWSHGIGKSDKTISNYSTALKGSLSRWATDVTGTHVDLYQIQDTTGLQQVKEQLAAYEPFIEKDRVGKSMYSAALKLYQKFLEGHSQHLLDLDIEELEQRNLDPTEKETLVSARRGQGIFRRRVLNQWGGCCAVTGYNDERFLLASHIKPWKHSSDSERLDRFNGLPLIPNLDKVFDLGFISFDPNGKILISDQLERPEILGVVPALVIKGTNRHYEYLEFHRSELFEG